MKSMPHDSQATANRKRNSLADNRKSIHARSPVHGPVMLLDPVRSKVARRPVGTTQHSIAAMTLWG